MKRARFISEGLAADVYSDGEFERTSEAGIYVYGFPGSTGPNPLTRFFTVRGVTMVQPHYFGTYDSAGLFSPGSAITSIDQVADVLSRGGTEDVKAHAPLDLPRNVTTLVGHSFGAFAALRAAKHISTLNTLILMGPAITFGKGTLGCGVHEDGEWQVSYVRRSRPYTYRLSSDDEWFAMYRGDHNPPKDPEETSRLARVVGLVGSQDKYFELVEE